MRASKVASPNFIIKTVSNYIAFYKFMAFRNLYSVTDFKVLNEDSLSDFEIVLITPEALKLENLLILKFQ